MLFLKNINTKRIIYHFIFWLSILLLYVSSKPSNISYSAFLYVYIWKIIIQAIGAYAIIYWIIPNTLNKKKYILFTITSFGWIYLVFTTLMFLKFYYLEPKFEGFFDNWPGHKMSLSQRLTSPFLIFGEFSFITYPIIIMGFISFNRKQQQLLKIEEEKKTMELKILKNQLNPHFLFNTLNNLYTLALKKDDKTPDVIAKLSEILDFVLYRCNSEYVTITDEINLLENYISLEKLRYGDKRVDIVFDKHINGTTPISPLILLTFLENAFKHGVVNETGKAKIHLSLYSFNDSIEFKIENTKPQNDSNSYLKKSQIGLINIKRQLNILYPNKHTLSIEETTSLYTVKLQLTI